MRTQHFEAFEPVCPRCLRDGKGEFRLLIQTVSRSDKDSIEEGILGCSAGDCRLEYPVIDGIPVLHPDPRAYLSENANQVMMRWDFADAVASLLGDALGPGSSFDVTRQHLSTYAWDHYAEFDPQEITGMAPLPGGATRVLNAALELLGPESVPSGPVLDLGCSTGRTSFDLAARSDELVLGVDMSFAMLQVARRALREGRVSYPRRRCGVVYDNRSFDVDVGDADKVDFWLCDSLSLPFRDQSFAQVVALNLIDCVYDPVALLLVLNRLLQDEGAALLATPFDWAPSATPIEGWIGGHSQRGADAGSSVARMQTVLEGLRAGVADFRLGQVADRDSVPWHARMHDRSVVLYSAYVQALTKALVTA